MLRPSRPMIRPFMSSEGSSITEAVVSAAWLAATRWSASATRLRARRRASTCASSSCWRTRRASSCRISSSERSISTAFASPTVMPAIVSSSSSSRSFASLSSCWSCLACTSRSLIPCSRRSSSRARRSSSSSRSSRRASTFSSRPRCSARSRSSSARTLTASSRASMPASRRIASAWRVASASSSSRVRCAAAAREPAAERSTSRTPTTPIRRPISTPVTISISFLPFSRCGARSPQSPKGPHNAIGSRSPPGLQETTS